MSLSKGKVKTNAATIKSEVVKTVDAGEAVVEEASEALPFDEGVPATEATEEEVVSYEADSKVVPIQPAAKAVATSSGGQSQVMAELDEQGFGGLELGFGSFPIIALKTDGEFVDTDATSYDEEFDCVVNSTRTKYVIKNVVQGDEKEKKKNSELVYSYDNVSDTNGNSIQEIITEWSEQGWGYESKPYIEGFATLVVDGLLAGSVMLSVPKTSINRMSGYITQNRLRHGLMPNQYVTKCKVGDKILNVDFPFYPWVFEFVQPLEE